MSRSRRSQGRGSSAPEQLAASGEGGGIRLLPVRGLPEVTDGDDVAALIAEHTDLRPGDVVVVAQKVISKAEGAVATARPGERPHDARRRIAREQARRIVADTPWVLITETPHGFVCANGGVDASNAPEGTFVLLPRDPDGSARRIRAGLRVRTGHDVPVVVTDTFGRPWRLGQTEVAIGVSGLAPIRDERGGPDRSGAILEVTETAVADELAAAADLVRRKADGVPVVVVRGFDWAPDDAAGGRDLVRPPAQDLFRRGAGTLARALSGERGTTGAVDPADATPAPFPTALAEPDLETIRRVAATADAVVTAKPGPRGTVVAIEGDRMAAGLVVATLADLGYVVTWRDEQTAVIVEVGRDPASEPEQSEPQRQLSGRDPRNEEPRDDQGR